MTYDRQDVVEFFRGDAGDSEATTTIHKQEMFPNNVGAVGYGFGYGETYGYDTANARGYGYGYGYQYGFGLPIIEVETEPLPRGTYPIKMTVTDAHGNESTAYETTVDVLTYARPASGLTVDSYVQGTVM